MKLTREFFLQDVTVVAQNLLGKVLCVRHGKDVLRARIVETESYGGITDKAAHSYGGLRTRRTEVMYAEGGHVYVYLIYGMYTLLNLVTGPVGDPEAVLIRAVEPLTPLIVGKTNGPGRLTKAMGIGLSYYGIDAVTSDELYLEDDGYEIRGIEESKRINIDYAQEDKDRLWRFSIHNNPFVSKDS